MEDPKWRVIKDSQSDAHSDYLRKVKEFVRKWEEVVKDTDFDGNGDDVFIDIAVPITEEEEEKEDGEQETET